MKKRKNQKGASIPPNPNPVAKYARLFNKTQTFTDKTKYNRKIKHPRQEANPMIFIEIIGLAS